uniref:Uncharacterized protein n=1 Tax=Anopheles dirus TaxID=7168 RepID=A0A182NB28_9DIPT
MSDDQNNSTSINSDHVAEPIEPFIAQTESSTIIMDDSFEKTEFINSGTDHMEEPITQKTEAISLPETQGICPEKHSTESCNVSNEAPMPNEQLSANIHPKDEQNSSAVKITSESSLEIAPNEYSISEDSITKDAGPDKPVNVSEEKTVLVEEPALQNIPEDPAQNNVANPEHEMIVDIPMARSNVIPAPHKGNFATIANKKPLEKKTKPSVLADKKKRLPPSRSSQSSLSSLGPSSSSLCHLTELSQPKPETLQTTLMCLRHLHGKNAQHLGSIERHLRGLRNNPKHGLGGRKRSNYSEQKRKMNAPARPLPAQSNEDEENEPSNRQIFDRFAEHLFEHLERKRAQQNYETSKLMMPVQIGYYSAAYDALVEAFGHSYHKCTLELYQQLAAELGLEAEMFVIDKTPKTNQGDEGLESIELSNFTDDQMMDFIGRHEEVVPDVTNANL